MTRVFTAYIEYDRETKLYVGIVPSISGAHTQGENLVASPIISKLRTKNLFKVLSSKKLSFSKPADNSNK